jgi:hypothetical protein
LLQAVCAAPAWRTIEPSVCSSWFPLFDYSF